MFYRNTVKRFILIFMMMVITLLSFDTFAVPSGSYEGSSDSRYFKAMCSTMISDLKNGGVAFISDGFSHNLGYCLIDARDRSIRLVRNYTNCDILELAVAESCSGIWGFMGGDHKACVNERSKKIGRNPGWVYNFGYCHTACPSINPPVLNAPPVNLPPCGLHVIPPDI